jgi:protein-S-isoprenylcysteine O-methyltransferase Ste14
MLSLRTLAWLACVVYSTIPCFWFLIHPWTDYWRSRRRSPYRVLLPAWIAMWIIAAFVTAPYRHSLLYNTPWTWIPAAALFATGVWLYSQSGKDFSAKQLGGVPEVIAEHREQRLVISGIRARIRHPVYLAHLCELCAWSIGSGLLVCYALTVFAMLTGALMIHMEDRELEQRFGDEYRTYRKTVSSILPRLPHSL